MTRFERAVHKLLFTCLNMKKGESLLVVYDEKNSHFAAPFIEKSLLAKIETYQLVVPPRALTPQKMSSIPRDFVSQTDATILITQPTLIHSKIIHHACHNGKRVICLNTSDAKVFENAMSADLNQIKRMSRKIADIFSIGKLVEVKSRAGTDFTFRIARHRGNINHGCAYSAGEFGILPAGEAYVIPDKNSTNGIVVIDGSIPELGLVRSPIKLRVKKGYVSQISGGELTEKLRKRIKPFGKNGRNIAEFGIGTNPGIQLTGVSTADEKKLGTAHSALGNHLLEGGSLTKDLHLDLIFNKPTIIVDGRQLMVSGKLGD